jgi:hypothetical protein
VGIDRVVHERLSYPGADPLAGDHLREREGGRAEWKELGDRDPSVVFGPSPRRDQDACEQCRVDGIDHAVVAREGVRAFAIAHPGGG